MDLYGQKSKSIPQKIVIHLLELLFLSLSFWLLFESGGHLVATKLGVLNSTTFLTRRLILFSFFLIAFARLSFMMFFLLKRKIPWEESVSIPMAFALYYIGFSLFVLPTAKAIDAIDIAGILLFLAGSTINTTAEVLRNEWKKQPANKGKIYTERLFKWSMHVNYFGDLLWVTACAILTRNLYSAAIPLFLCCFFVFYNIPKLDRYLHQHYGPAFEDYARRTRKFIPFLY
jgi:protein-S-isoprenylcysteine O-methyltransferase Ste14